jgi:ribosomal protein L34E
VNRRTKTPGGKLVYLYKKKLGAIPKCGDCKVKLHGVSIQAQNCIELYDDKGTKKCVNFKVKSRYRKLDFDFQLGLAWKSLNAFNL